MTRAETTKFLGKLLTDTRLGGAGSHWASEVSIDPWTPKARRVDYMEFSPANQCSVSGIEKGIFTCGAGWLAAVFVAGGSFIQLVRFRIQEDRQLQKRALRMQRYKEE